MKLGIIVNKSPQENVCSFSKLNTTFNSNVHMSMINGLFLISIKNGLLLVNLLGVKKNNIQAKTSGGQFCTTSYLLCARGQLLPAMFPEK